MHPTRRRERKYRPAALHRVPRRCGAEPRGRAREVGGQPGGHARTAGTRILVALALAALAACSRGRDVILGPGVMAPDAPVQEAAPERVREVSGHRLRTRAGFSVTAKLLSKRRYRWDDMAAVVPWDFALAWDALSDEALLAGTRLAQGDRRMFWHLYDVPLPLSLIEHASANVHVIAANPEISRQLKDAPTGAIITLRGELVDLFFPDGSVIPTSVSRYDRGDGACEILYVTEVAVAEQLPSSRVENAGVAGRGSAAGVAGVGRGLSSRRGGAR